MLFGWTELPTSDQIKRAHDRTAGDPVIEKEDESNFKKLGYSDESIARMKENLTRAGYPQR